MSDLETMSIVHRKKIEGLEAELEQKDAKLEEKSLEQNEKIERLTREFNKKLAIERQKREQERMHKDLKERDENLEKLRLEFLLTNQRKMKMQ